LFFPIKKIEKEGYTRKRPMYENERIPCTDSSNLMQKHLIYNISVAETSYDREIVSEWLLRSPDDGLKIHGKLP
jgi:hypothetical protein